ncbi:hypothetical protein H2200_012225 [Cladophialophora chaetospira]|uniref:NAD(P)-binding domain-containing protein n=1 Tax=Cladophialophora chaetospira TaxID=386627 RepID=A0AA38WYI4_9EURO|nr:hypothetical protein H2200_012225 [Cladophialophora chaetospira]
MPRKLMHNEHSDHSVMANIICVLGATGKTGSGVVKELLAKTDVKIHVYVRSLGKLLALFPHLNSDDRVSIFEGSIRDAELMTKCLSGTKTIIFTLGDNDNRPMTIIEDGAKTVLSALQTLSESSKSQPWTVPRLILLSSSTWNPRFAAARPALVHWAIKTAFTQPYDDLRRGTALFMGSPALCRPLLVQPGALMQDNPSGHEISTESVRLTATYADLAAAFVELATEPAYDDLTAVGVSSKHGDNPLKYGPLMGYWIIKGLCAQFIPGFWPVHDSVTAFTAWLIGHK